MSSEFSQSVLTEAMTAHFRALKTQSIQVPEWELDGKPVVIWFDPLSMQDRIDLNSDDPTFLAKVIIKKAKNAQGTAYYTLEDLPTFLHQTAPSIISRIANRILNADMIDPKLLGESSPPGG